jgi:hypothetical protein
MPDPVNTETTQQEVTPQGTGTPQNQNREQLYQQYYKSDTPPPQETVVTTQAPQEPDFKALYEAQQADLTQIKAALAGLTAAGTATAPPPQKVQEGWFELLQQGRRTEAEQVLKDYVAQGASEKIVQETVRQALELSRTEREIEDYNNFTRSQNPDMLDVEDLVSLKAEQKFRANQANIKTTKDYIETYKKSVADSIQEMRNVLRRTRAAGKDEGLTIRKEVLNSSTVQPNKIIINRENQAEETQSEPENSPTSYLEMRKASSYRARNPQIQTQQA